MLNEWISLLHLNLLIIKIMTAFLPCLLYVPNAYKKHQRIPSLYDISPHASYKSFPLLELIWVNDND